MTPRSDLGFGISLGGLGSVGATTEAWSTYVEPLLQGFILVGTAVGVALLLWGRWTDNRIKSKKLENLEKEDCK